MHTYSHAVSEKGIVFVKRGHGMLYNCHLKTGSKAGPAKPPGDTMIHSAMQITGEESGRRAHQVCVEPPYDAKNLSFNISNDSFTREETLTLAAQIHSFSN